MHTRPGGQRAPERDDESLLVFDEADRSIDFELEGSEGPLGPQVRAPRG
jgi:hypothetical protein